MHTYVQTDQLVVSSVRKCTCFARFCGFTKLFMDVFDFSASMFAGR